MTEQTDRRLIADAAFNVLSEVGEPLQLNEILTRIQSSGLATIAGQTPQLIISRVMSRDECFERRGTGNQWSVRKELGDIDIPTTREVLVAVTKSIAPS